MGRECAMWDIFVPNIAPWPRPQSHFTRDNFFSPRWPRSRDLWDLFDSIILPVAGGPGWRRPAPAENAEGSRMQNQSQFFLALHTGLNNDDVETVHEDVSLILKKPVRLRLDVDSEEKFLGTLRVSGNSCYPAHWRSYWRGKKGLVERMCLCSSDSGNCCINIGGKCIPR